MTARTILLTGANSSLALPAVHHLLTNYLDNHAVLTVRDPSASNQYTDQLRAIIAPFENRVSIRALDLSDLSSVRNFASTLATEIKAGSIPPLTSIICNAYYWNLTTAPEFTTDGFEKTFQVTYLAHTILIQQLLNSFGAAENDTQIYCGRIVLLGSDTIFPGKAPFEKYPPRLPDNLEELAKPTPETDGDHMGHGFYRYAVSKLAIVAWMYALNDFLQKPENPHLRKITAVAIDPGNLSDSRALRINTPLKVQMISRFIVRPFRPILSFMNPTMRTAASAGVDVVDLAAAERFEGATGYFTLLNKDEGPPDSLDKAKQGDLWKKTTEWSSK